MEKRRGKREEEELGQMNRDTGAGSFLSGQYIEGYQMTSAVDLAPGLRSITYLASVL